MNGSVVLVDDNDDLLESLSEFLQMKGFNILGCGHNGLEAVQLYEEYRPDVVLLDLSMPNYDGIYGLENIKKINPNAKVIILTGHYNEKNREKIRPFDVSKIMEKPCSLTQLDLVLKSLSMV
ncbi:response regulator [Nitrosopumilus adriaticus]|uniref:Putative chemotaxis response regulator receiver protein CheY n=1 Tax=Nitrosopumilus adriaticus TaxID=1580092 RepID=A0A0D5C5U9_9ARCH|nr:response regulator [Nitrosopumilus adriaticus]AJW71762.1 putative chemotaxis response regulator receiver protein CheY [Nitrosopumilus adriaticus]